MSIISYIRSFRRWLNRTRPLVEVGISQTNLLHNLHTYKSLYPGLKIAPVLKSNAYGHDIGLVARLLDHEDVAFFMVDSLYEARRLRDAGIRSRIVIMGYVRPDDVIECTLHHVEFGIVDIEQLRDVAKRLRRRMRFHLKIDTGMHRQGISPRFIQEAIKLAKSNPHFEVIGVGSHFADADGPDPTFTKKQIEVWKEALATLMSAFPTITDKHIAATKGVPLSQETGTNIARVGIGLYGFDTAPEGATQVRPVLEMRSIVTSVRDVPAGDAVGYNATFTAQRPTRIATVPVGYFEGYDRRLSNQGVMLIDGMPCPVAGRVSMNITCLDVTDHPGVRAGDEVTVISRNPAERNSVSALTRTVSTADYQETEYVILVHIPQHLRRVVE